LDSSRYFGASVLVKSFYFFDIVNCRSHILPQLHDIELELHLRLSVFVPIV